MTYQLITDDVQLAVFCQQALGQACLALDTEFVRTHTLRPKLGLIQLYAGDKLVLVDPLCIGQWQPLADLLAAPQVLKLIHSCNEDLDALATVGLTEIKPLLDTQLAAELAGMGSSVGYAKLVEQLSGQVLDKSESRTDWLARPLAETQLQYAANDVFYLWHLKDKLIALLPQPRFFDLLISEGEQMINRRHFQLPAAFKYLELKNSWQSSVREIAVLQQLMMWRQQYAEEKDQALGMILKEPLLYELAKKRPASLESLAQLPELHPRELRRYGNVLLRLIENAKTQEHSIKTFYHTADFPGYKQVQQLLNDAIQRAATASGIPASFLSVKRQLNEYLNWCWRVSDEERSQLPYPEFLRGWRREILLPYLPIPKQVAHLVLTPP